MARTSRLAASSSSCSASTLGLKYVDLTADRRVMTAVGTGFQERSGQLSPDGKYIASESNESGTFQIDIATFPDASTRWLISPNAGRKPRWTRDGRELTYVDSAGMLQSVGLTLNRELKAGSPLTLFELAGIEIDGFHYAVSPDGSSFLVMRASRHAPPSRLSVIVNSPMTVAR